MNLREQEELGSFQWELWAPESHPYIYDQHKDVLGQALWLLREPSCSLTPPFTLSQGVSQDRPLASVPLETQSQAQTVTSQNNVEEIGLNVVRLRDQKKLKKQRETGKNNLLKRLYNWKKKEVAKNTSLVTLSESLKTFLGLLGITPQSSRTLSEEVLFHFWLSDRTPDQGQLYRSFIVDQFVPSAKVLISDKYEQEDPRFQTLHIYLGRMEGVAGQHDFSEAFNMMCSFERNSPRSVKAILSMAAKLGENFEQKVREKID